jgi:DNA-binding phage protein
MVKAAVDTKLYDSADYLKTPEAIAAYLKEALAEKVIPIPTSLAQS